MYGAIIGDLSGSIYEYEQTKEIKNIYTDELIKSNSFYSDDTILTIAILDAIINNGNYEYYLKKYIHDYKDYHPDFKPYFKYPFSLNTIRWANGVYPGCSCGNGALMRVSPVGYMFNNEKDVIDNAYESTIVSHNSKEAIECTRNLALIIFYLRNGFSLNDIYKKLNLRFDYIPFEKFNTRCYETLNNCLYVLYNSNDFEESIKLSLLMGGDTDTNACIVGSMSEALYGISDDLKNICESKIPKEFVHILRRSGCYK